MKNQFHKSVTVLSLLIGMAGSYAYASAFVSQPVQPTTVITSEVPASKPANLVASRRGGGGAATSSRTQGGRGFQAQGDNSNRSGSTVNQARVEQAKQQQSANN